MGWSNKTVTKGSSTSQQTEDPTLTSTRLSLIPEYNFFLQQAKKPVFGEAEQANIYNTSNAAMNSAIKRLSSSLAGRGALTSGALASGIGDIAQTGMGQKLQASMQIPLENRQALTRSVLFLSLFYSRMQSIFKQIHFLPLSSQ